MGAWRARVIPDYSEGHAEKIVTAQRFNLLLRCVFAIVRSNFMAAGVGQQGPLMTEFMEWA